MDSREAIVYLRRENGFAISRLQRGAARSARKRSEAIVMFLEKMSRLERLDGWR